MIPISEPYLSKKTKKYLNKCYESNWISSQGKYIKDLERLLAKYHNVKHCILTSSCTSALHLSLKSLGIGPGDEVICPDLTFIAPANMVALSGAKLKLVDIDPETLTIDPDKIEKKISKKTKAIIVVHQFGHSADMDPIIKIAKKHRLKIIEDNAESIGGKYKGKKLGTIGDVATLSFTATNFYCGEVGNGTRMKLCANYLVHVHVVAAAECLVMGQKAGLDPDLIQSVLIKGAGGSKMLEVRGAMMAKSDYREGGGTMFDVFEKDASIITEHAANVRAPIELYVSARQKLNSAIALGLGHLDTSAVCKSIELSAGIDRDLVE